MKRYAINELMISSRVEEHIWKHRVYKYRVYDVIDDPDTIFEEKTDSLHGRVLIAIGRDRGGMPLILHIAFADEKRGSYRLKTARRPDKNEYRRFFR